jgi:hypothetical protein
VRATLRTLPVEPIGYISMQEALAFSSASWNR